MKGSKEEGASPARAAMILPAAASLDTLPAVSNPSTFHPIHSRNAAEHPNMAKSPLLE